MASEPTSRTPSPEKGLASIIRRGSKRNSNTSSLVSLASEETGVHQRRNSLRAGLDKLKDTTSRRVSSDLEARHGESPNRLSRLLRARPGRKPSGSDQILDYEDSTTEQRGITKRGSPSAGKSLMHSDSNTLRVMNNDGGKLNLANASTESFGANRSAASSLLTEDSDPDAS